ncbi:hypothetical protein [Mariniblastus fucicola]|uniref:Uncharacterized protein n=1 Tax=Mariniblastus fucicola TaxID=980251 RepID=A0A5B9PFK5_9BACT|nr:hypothetical protein [Mariniblastus fucicola]QEG23975.1 hypothetical protein MFFC18_38800 [Mariniblastus fucicola]
MNLARRIRSFLLATAVLLGMMVCAAAVVEACPFCAAVGLTFTDQMASKDVVVSAKLLEIPEPDDDAEELPRAKFEIVKVFRGKELVKEGMQFKALLVGRYPVGQKFFVMGVDPPRLNWTTPMKASDRVLEYLDKLGTLPESGADRLAFFQEFFEDEESLLAFDAYDEFAKAPYEDLIALKDRMDRERLIKLINDDKTSPNRRRLYFTMLGVCGQPEDAKMLEELLLSGSRRKLRGLEALIACYLNIKGEAGMALIQREFFENKDCEFTYTMLAMQALRFHAEETDIIPKDRIVAAARKVLDNDEARDLVIPDLARWEDWSVMDKLVKIFKESSDDDSWIRVPIASYLMACPLPEAKKHLKDLEEIDKASIARAKFLGGMDFDDDEAEEADEDESADESSDSKVSLFVPLSDDSPQFVSLADESTQSAIDIDEPSFDEPVRTRHVVKKVEQPAFEISTESGSLRSGRQNVLAKMEASDDARVSESNPREETFVSSNNASNQTILSSSSQSGIQVARTNPAPIPAAPVIATSPNLTWQIIFIPMAVSIVLFVLLWSVLSGWFERLIF